MARTRKMMDDPEPTGPVVAKGDNLGVPTRKIPASAPAARSAVPAGAARIDAVTAGQRSGLFRAGGEAFAAWVRGKGIDPAAKMPTPFWDSLLSDFAVRPVSGHRRRVNGDHQSNRADLR